MATYSTILLQKNEVKNNYNLLHDGGVMRELIREDDHTTDEHNKSGADDASIKVFTKHTVMAVNALLMILSHPTTAFIDCKN